MAEKKSKKIPPPLEMLVRAQMHYPQDVSFGALWCEVHGVAHVRAAVALFPFAYYAAKGHELWNEAGQLAQWVTARQEPAGLWFDAITGEELTGLVLCSLAMAAPYLKKKLTAIDCRGMMDSIERACVWCLKRPRTQQGTPAHELTIGLGLVAGAVAGTNTRLHRKGMRLVQHAIRHLPPVASPSRIHTLQDVLRQYGTYVENGEYDSDIHERQQCIERDAGELFRATLIRWAGEPV